MKKSWSLGRLNYFNVKIPGRRTKKEGKNVRRSVSLNVSRAKTNITKCHSMIKMWVTWSRGLCHVISSDSDLYQEVTQQFSQIKIVKIKGSSKCDLHYSSLSRENLAFSVAYFTSAHELSLHHCYAENIRGFDKLKGTLRVLSFEGQSKSITTVLANGGEFSMRESLYK